MPGRSRAEVYLPPAAPEATRGKEKGKGVVVRQIYKVTLKKRGRQFKATA